MTIKGWRVEVVERYLQGKEFKFQKQPRLSFAVRADVPSNAKKEAKAYFRENFSRLGDMINVAICPDNKLRIYFEAHREDVVPLPGKIQQRPPSKLSPRK